MPPSNIEDVVKEPEEGGHHQRDDRREVYRKLRPRVRRKVKDLRGGTNLMMREFIDGEAMDRLLLILEPIGKHVGEGEGDKED